MIDFNTTRERLRNHLTVLTRDIGERSVRRPENLNRTAAYLHAFHREIPLESRLEPYGFRGMTVHNVVASLAPDRAPRTHYVVGAHYDSVTGTVGADDNAGALAVQLETARILAAPEHRKRLTAAVTFVAFALEEPPAYGTRYMGSRVYAARARGAGTAIDGMICLEMVGYTCRTPGCQHYPFPLMFMDYPDTGEFIGIVGNFRSRPFARKLLDSFRKNRQLPVIGLTVPFDGLLMPTVRLSDHASFWREGFRAVMVTDSAFYRNPHYHMPSDTLETLDFDFMAQLVESLVGFFLSPEP
ncbi:MULTISPECIES: M28 family peptidase [Desulfococcus]|uniref:Peptidase M28 n=1 Tax=Desulfococcus multivorans DSM 2059 TaxID=1121405 RepID=S7TTI1_DESML|nr:M28 family peptidase [Desulfococcus multivorans]AOY57620.1 peptidase, M28 family [Desulfococcus multivorans]AQV00027.1 peptidase M28 [Desulfococcus multivorans]EPR40387.1 peptidase M28 [Desulfococcus multivorans DSM 2059]SJZ77193.1 Peptidase family M28 [Desulfococcus multivorans DSM 2059]